MNLNTIRDNLKNTIADKQEFLTVLLKEHEYAEISDTNNVFVYSLLIRNVEISLTELNAILTDIETVIDDNATKVLDLF